VEGVGSVALVIFRQFVDADLGCASYLVGDGEADEAFLVDPAYEIDHYLAAAEQEGVRIVRTLETHTHADHVSGHGRLALEHGIPVSVHPAAGTEHEHDDLSDGDELVAGEVVLRVVHTPGHRPEHCCFVVVDRSRAPDPWLVLTGDSLFVGDAARPDLAVDAADGARDLYASLQRLLELPDGVEVYPGHVAGSLCGASMSSKASTTIGFERRFNPMLATGSPEEFASESAHVRSPRPPNLERIVELNRGAFVAAPAPVEEVDSLDPPLLDVRAADVFARGHAPGAINVPLARSGFATKAAFMLHSDERPLIVARTADEAADAARRLRAVGFLELGGYVLHAPETETLEPIDVDEAQRLLEEEAIEVIDVRELHERDDGYIPGSRNIPYRLVREYGEELKEEGRPVVTICDSGARAAIAASVLAAAGVHARPVLYGGVPNWEENGGATVEFRRCGDR
jgi:glyoxylase-like metal-dependent hydrolase (beta-lactamase superfamily II)/rhodanese-related sulfurtransferase